jgi:uncharacterized repeat protein (TIGR01451 family)
MAYTGHRKRRDAQNMYGRNFYISLGVLISIGLAFAAPRQGAVGQPADQTAVSPISIKAIAEVELRSTDHGQKTSKLMPADRVASGDWVIYTLEVRNKGTATAPAPTVMYAIPDHMVYVADSAVGPGTDVSYSVDGGRSFAIPEKLKMQNADGQLRPAGPADYTHIRWQLKNGLKGNSVAFVRFRAQAK